MQTSLAGNEDAATNRAARWLKFAAIALLILFAQISLDRCGPYHTASGKQWGSATTRSDFSVYRLVGRAVLDHTDIYELRNDRGWAYVYPPAFAVAMIPFAWISVQIGVFVWYCISAGFTIWIAVMCYRYVLPRLTTARQRLIVAAVPMTLLAVWFGTAFARSQASVLMACLVIAAVYSESRGLTLAGGAALAGAVLVKVFPIALLGYYIWRGKWKFVGATLIALFVGAILLPAPIYGWRGNLNYLREFKQVVAEPALASSEKSRSSYVLYAQLFNSAKPRNQSLQSVFYRYGGQPGQTAAWILAGLMGCAILWTGRKRVAAAEPAILGAYMTWMLVASPISEDHYYTLLLLPMTIAVAYVWTAADPRAFRIGRASLWVFGGLSVAAVVYRRFELWGVVCWSAVLLWLLLLYLARVAPTESQSGPHGMGMADADAAVASMGNADGGD
jgi:alpha-1,2-mannosyltransferase